MERDVSCVISTQSKLNVEEEGNNEVRNFKMYIIWTKILNRISWGRQILLV
jgi:hypothetical protein